MFEHTLRPRFSETDGLGHINNAVIPVWLEEARTPVFRIFNPTLSLTEWNLILKKYEIDFVSQIMHEDEVTIETTIESVGNTSLVINQMIKQKGVSVAVGRTVMVHFDYETARPTPIPDEIRAKLERHRT